MKTMKLKQKSPVGLSAYSRKAVAWVRAQAMALEGTVAVKHIRPRAYCTAKPAPGCAVFITPWQDAEEQIRTPDFAGSAIVYEGVCDIAVGDWCALAYVVKSGNMRTVAFALGTAPDRRIYG